MPPISHFVYIPLVLAIGIYMGWQLGSSSVQNAWDKAERKRAREEAE